MKMKDQNAKREKLSEKGDKAKQGLREIPFLGER